MVARIILAAVLILGVDREATAEGTPEINTVLMHSTFKLSGVGSAGTAFILGQPDPRHPGAFRRVLATAAHVLENMKTDDAVLWLRTRKGAGYRKLPLGMKVKDKARPLWTKHPAADIAVMYIEVPTIADVGIVSTDVLATDEMLEKVSMHPGDRLSCLGFPYSAEGNEAGFPILRSGYIASYPLTPTKQTKTFLFDFNVFEGNSGGPVYFVESNRGFGGSPNLGRTVQFLIGIVIQQASLEEEVKSIGETRKVQHPLGLGIVVHASLIREALALLPADKSETSRAAVQQGIAPDGRSPAAPARR